VAVWSRISRTFVSLWGLRIGPREHYSVRERQSSHRNVHIISRHGGKVSKRHICRCRYLVVRWFCCRKAQQLKYSVVLGRRINITFRHVLIGGDSMSAIFSTIGTLTRRSCGTLATLRAPQFERYAY
jgi:hypothetical protein